MALAFQIVQAPMRMGLEEAVEPHQVPFGTLTRANNACWSKSGLLQKRLGALKFTNAILGGGTISAGARLMPRGDELDMTDGSNLYAYTASGWASRGAIPSIGITWATMTAGLNTVRSADVAVAGSAITEAWVTGEQTIDSSNRLTYQVTDETTGVLTTAPTLVSGAIPRDHIRVVTDGTSAWVVYSQVTGANGGKVYVLPVGGTAAVVATDAPSGNGLTFALDAIIIGTDIIIAYTLAAGGVGLLRVSATSTPTVSTTGSVVETSTEVASISLSGASGEPLFVAWGTSGDGSGTDYVKYSCVNATTFATTLATQTLYATGGVYALQVVTVTLARYSSTQALVCYSLASQDIGTSALDAFTVDSSGGTGDSGGGDRTFGVLSRPTLIGSRWLITVANYPEEAGVGHTSGTALPTSEVLVLDITPSSTKTTPVQQGKIECLTGSFWAQGFFANVSSGYVATPFADVAVYGASGMVAKVLTGARRTRFVDGGGEDMWRTLSLGREAVFAAGVLCSYDGERARGYGFATGPLVSTLLTTTSTTGGNLAAGTYLYNLTAERRSASGLLYRSPNGLSKPVTTTGSTSHNTIGVVASSLDYSTTNPGAFLGYRSTVNGLVLQRLAVPPKTMTLSLASTSHTISDTLSDASAGLAIRPALYTEGGELEDMQPPSALTLAYHQHRVWMVAGDGFTLWFSKDRTVNPEIAPGFHPSQTLLFDAPVTAMAVLDDKLIVFAADRVWMLVGSGPDVTGLSASYEAIPIQTDVGCTNPRSVVTSPDGIIFQSERGIYLLTRKLEMNWIGRAIKDELLSATVASSTITSAVLVAAHNEVRFTVTRDVYGPGDGAPSLNTESAVLVYNYVESQWTTSSYYNGAIIADACLWQGRWTALLASGVVFRETVTGSLDTEADGVTSAWVPLTVETAWINATGPLTFQSVRNFSFEGVARSIHQVTIEVAFDSDDTYVQTKTFDVATIGAESFDISIGTRRKCHAIRFRISDTAPSVMGGSTGEGLSLATLGVEVGAKRGLPKKPASKTG